MMRRSKRGQSLVETALILPMLVVLLFSIIDLSYLVFNVAEVQFSARRAAEEGSKQPYCWMDGEAIKNQAKVNGAFSSAVAIDDADITISYWEYNGGWSLLGTVPNSGASTSGSYGLAGWRDDPKLDDLDDVVQIKVRNIVTPLTPVGQTVFGQNMVMVAYSRRTIIGLSSPLTGC